MSEAIPLRPALGVHVVDVIVGYVFMQRLDLVLEDFAAESRLARHV